MEIQQLAPQFYEDSLLLKGYSKETIRRYKYVLDLYCKISQKQNVETITEADIRSFLLHGRSQRAWSANTAIIFHKSLQVFFRWCIKRGYISINPVDGIERVKLEQKLPYKLTKQDALRLLDIVYNYPYESTFQRYRNYALFAVFIFAGLRRNEALQLRYTDVDIENNTLFIRQGKGKKDRFIPIPSSLTTILRQYTDQRKKANITCAELFASAKENSGFTVHGLKHLVDKIKRTYSVPFSIHKLRHTFATLMLEGGCDIYSLSKMMGHTDIKTTTIYLAATPEHLRCQMDKHPLNS